MWCRLERHRDPVVAEDNCGSEQQQKVANTWPNKIEIVELDWHALIQLKINKTAYIFSYLY